MTSKLTDEQLLEIAKADSGKADKNNQDNDVAYYQFIFNIESGKDEVAIDHLYFHYHGWSNKPISRMEFYRKLALEYKGTVFLHIDKSKCSIDFFKLLGDYVKFKKKNR